MSAAADEFLREVADQHAARLATDYPVTGVRVEGDSIYVDCYGDELPESGIPRAEPLRTYLVADDEALWLVGESCRYHLDLPAATLGLCEACLERYLEAGAR